MKLRRTYRGVDKLNFLLCLNLTKVTHGVQAGDLERSGLSKRWDENRLAAQQDGGIGPKATTV